MIPPRFPHATNVWNEAMKRTKFINVAALIAVAGLSFFVGQFTGARTIAEVHQPLIGVSILTSDSYLRAIFDSGGVPVVLPNLADSPEKIDE